MITEINLLKPANSGNTPLPPIAGEIRKLCIWSLILALAAGILTLGAYLVVQTTQQSLVRAHDQLKRQLEAEKSKESLLVAIKSRIDVVNKAIADTKHMGKILTLATGVTSAEKIMGVSQNEQDRITMNVKFDSIADASNMVTVLLGDINQKQIKTVQINSLTIDDKGNRIDFSFMPVWENL